DAVIEGKLEHDGLAPALELIGFDLVGLGLAQHHFVERVAERLRRLNLLHAVVARSHQHAGKAEQRDKLLHLQPRRASMYTRARGFKPKRPAAHFRPVLDATRQTGLYSGTGPGDTTLSGHGHTGLWRLRISKP